MALRTEDLRMFPRRTALGVLSSRRRFLLGVSMSFLMAVGLTTGAYADGALAGEKAGVASRSTSGASTDSGRPEALGSARSAGVRLAHLSIGLNDLAASAETPGQPDLYLPPVLSDGRSLAVNADEVVERELLVAPERIAALGSRHPIDVLLQSHSVPVLMTSRDMLAALSPDAAAAGFGAADFVDADADVGGLAVHDPEPGHVTPAESVPPAAAVPAPRQPVKSSPGERKARDPVLKAPAVARPAPVKPARPAASKPRPSIVKPDTAVNRAVAKAVQPAPVTARPAPAKPKMGQLDVQAARAFSRF